jgi:alkyl sulfatase BDS1-like metallo-beta-lactamase superfamily hydrolase
MSLDMVFDYMGIELDADRAKGKKLTINWDLPDTKQKYALFLERSVLNAWPNYQADNADATVTVDRSTLNEVLAKKLTPKQAIDQGKAKITGDPAKLDELLGCLDKLGNSFWFNIVTP